MGFRYLQRELVNRVGWQKICIIRAAVLRQLTNTIKYVGRQINR